MDESVALLLVAIVIVLVIVMMFSMSKPKKSRKSNLGTVLDCPIGAYDNSGNSCSQPAAQALVPGGVCCCQWNYVYDDLNYTCVPAGPPPPACSTANCPSPNRCNAQGQCAPPPACSTANCPPPKMCNAQGQCVKPTPPACSPVNCPYPNTCNPQGQCMPPQPSTCTTANCPPPNTCDAQGNCMRPPTIDCTTCAPYLCNATQTACLTSCPVPTSTAGCFNGMTAEGNVNNICNLNNQCVSCPKCPLGEGCMWVINKGPQCGTAAI